jgi:uncharacterized protein DUF2330
MRGRAFLTVVLAVGGLLAGPGVAGACACGAVLADTRLEPVQETALVELGDGTESVTLNIATEPGSGATEAAFVMPVPARASFELADGKIFGELDEFSQPRIEYRDVERDVDGDGAGAAPGQDGASDVTVTDQVTVGPYEVAQLTGTDATTVENWLHANGFMLPEAIGARLTPYLAEGWLVVAVRLVPTSGDFGLPPMRLSFPTTEPVYPMRLSAAAETAQPMRLYVLADHRMDASSPAPTGPDPDVTFAGWVGRDNLADYPLLAEKVTGTRFLTRYDGRFEPRLITDDMHLTQAATDQTHREVVYRTRYVDDGSTTTVIWLLAVVAAALVVATIAVLLRRSGRPPVQGAGGPR